MIRKTGIGHLRRKAMMELSACNFERVQFDVSVHPHYVPLRSNLKYQCLDGVEVEAIRGWAIVLVHPGKTLATELWDKNRKLHIPSFVCAFLRQQYSVLQLAAFTLESTLSILEHARSSDSDGDWKALHSDSSRTLTPLPSPRTQCEQHWTVFRYNGGEKWLYNEDTKEWFFISQPPKEWTRYQWHHVADDARTLVFYWWWHENGRWFLES